MTILSKGCKPDNFELHNSLKLSFTNIRSNLVDCEPFLESNFPDILALCETYLDDSINSGNFSVRVYVPLVGKDSIIHMHGIAVYVKERLPFARDLSLENSADSYLCFRLAQTTLPRWLTFLLGSQTLTLTVLLVWIYLFLLTLVFVLHCQILIMLLFQFALIPHRKYQVKPHSSPWFSPAYAAAIVHRNHFFCLYQQNESSESKVKFRQTSNRSKKVLETAKLACANKTKESITSQKLTSRNF